MTNLLEQIPDGVKVAASVTPSALIFFGFPIQEWMYFFSAIVSILFIIEKLRTYYGLYVERKKLKEIERSKRETSEGGFSS